jgi:hypothetical protein
MIKCTKRNKTRYSYLALNLGRVVLANLLDAALETNGLGVFVLIALALEGRAGSEHYVLGLVLHILIPLTQPRDVRVVTNTFPGMSRHSADGWSRILTHIQSDGFGETALLKCSCLRVFAATSEETWGLDVVIASLTDQTDRRGVVCN